MYEVNGEIQKEISNIPIGKPIANSEVFVVSPFNTLCPSGVVGELFVGGDGVANGYLNQKEKNKRGVYFFR